MAKVALVSHDVQTVQGRAGGVGAFVTHWAKLLKNSGDKVTIILTHAELQTPGLDPLWAAKYRSWGIDFIELHSDPPSADRWPEAWAMRLSEKLHPILLQYDAVYFQDWANLAFHTVRVNRFTANPGPSCITVLHGPSNWVRLGNRKYPQIPDDLHLEFIERYSAEHSDVVIAPSNYILEWAKKEGWKFRTAPVVLGLPYNPADEPEPMPEAPAKKRVMFFGRLETRKGATLFTNALLVLWRDHPHISESIEEIVLLGHEDEPGSAETIKRHLATTGLRVVHLGNLDSEQAGRYLREHARGAVAVIASAYENFPYAVIETSLIPGLNLICSRGGGIPEVLSGRADERMFDPEPDALAAKLQQVLLEGKSNPSAPPYDFSAANDAWLALHRDILKHPRRKKDGPMFDAQPSVSVCIPYFNKARYFPELLSCLEAQTLTQFTVVVVDDGSHQPEAKAVFDAMAEKYQPLGWLFLRQQNAFVDAARNAAARRSDSEFLFFIDADDLIPPHAIQRMLEAAVISGVDCLVSASVLFSGDEPPYTTTAKYMPIGANLAAGLIEPIIFGGPMILVRRKVFEAIGGYREVRGAAHEDWELQARLAMHGYDTDILPEYLHQYRQLPDGLAKTSDGFTAKRRIIDCYEEQFAKIGMHGMGGAMFALYRRCQELEGAVRESVPLDLRMRLHDRLSKMLGRPQ
jgi:glycosyltransferase involved in cell wall biosynthesis